MSDGGIGDPGLTYCATIRISGNLNDKELQGVVGEIEAILKRPKVEGKIENHARVSKDASFDANIRPIQKS